MSTPTVVTQRIGKTGAKYFAVEQVIFEVQRTDVKGHWVLIDNITGIRHLSRNEEGITLEHWLRNVRAHIRTEHHITVKGIEN